MSTKMICIHLGARAHYLIPKALAAEDNLEALVTDTWVSSAILRGFFNKLPLRILKSFSGRYVVSIPSNKVYSFGFRFLLRELYLRIKYKNNWEQIIQRNAYFENIVTGIFKELPSSPAVFGFSYTSLQVFKIAAGRGQKTIMFQIDPGCKEEQIVAEIVTNYGNTYRTTWEPAPVNYWNDWKKECELSDVIMVNSGWSKDGLTEYGINPDKIKIVPLPFQLESKHTAFKKEYPQAFTKKRPLRCLFLGTLTLRKGIHLVLKAAAQLADKPIEFVLVGQNELDMALLSAPNISYKGIATRVQTDEYYQQSDVFLFPTLSDGFGLTQLEALAWQLPVIASTCCGKVITDGYNGMEMSECTIEQLCFALLKCLEEPQYLQKLSANGIETVKMFSLENFAKNMSAL